MGPQLEQAQGSSDQMEQGGEGKSGKREKDMSPETRVGIASEFTEREKGISIKKKKKTLDLKEVLLTA